MHLFFIDVVVLTRRIAQVFDLKGSTRNRYVDVKGEGKKGTVLLDQNFMECM